MKMKKKCILLCWFACLSMAGWAQNVFIIEGEVKNVEEGTIIELLSDVKTVAAVDTLCGGRFYFELPAKGKGVSELSISGTRNSGFPPMNLDIWVKPGSRVKIKGENRLLYTWQVESNIPQQNTRAKFVNASRELWDRYQMAQIELRKKDMHSSAHASMSQEEKKRLQVRIDSLRKTVAQLEMEIDGRILPLMKQLPVDEVWMWQLNLLSYRASSVEDYPYKNEVIALYNALPDAQKASYMGKEIHVQLFSPKVVKVGDAMADGDLYDLQGGVHHLADFKGKYILLDFWSRGCSACLMALPEMREMAELYKDRLTMVSISVDNKTGWEAASKRHGIAWWNLNELKGQTGLYARYGVRGIPHYILISPEGIVLEHWAGYGKGLLRMKLRNHLAD